MKCCWTNPVWITYHSENPRRPEGKGWATSNSLHKMQPGRVSYGGDRKRGSIKAGLGGSFPDPIDNGTMICRGVDGGNSRGTSKTNPPKKSCVFVFIDKGKGGVSEEQDLNQKEGW